MADAHAHVDAFLTHLRAERGLSPHTIRAYSTDLRQFLEWAERTKVDPLATTHRVLRRYLAEMDAAGYARRTIARRLAAVRSFYAYLIDREVIDTDPSSVLATPKVPRRLPKTVAESDLSALLDAPDTTTPAGLRDRALLELLYATGARIGEISALDVGDIDLANGQIRVMGKGSKQRILPIHAEAAPETSRLSSTLADRCFSGSRHRPCSSRFAETGCLQTPHASASSTTWLRWERHSR